MRALHSCVMVAVVGLVSSCSGDGDDDPAGGSDAGNDDGGVPPAVEPEVEPPVGLWVRSIEGVGSEGVNSITARADASFVVLGSYQGPGTFNPGEPDEMELAMPDGESESVLVHYAPDGSLRSLRADPLGTGSGRVHMVTDGTMYTAGSGAFTAGDVMVPDDTDVFVAKYAPDGTPLWAKSASGEAGMGVPTALAAWPDGSVAVSGTFEGTITFDVDGPNETRLAADPISEEIFLARYDADGELLWAKRAIEATYQPDWNLEAGADGATFIWGTLENNTTFNPGLADETRLPGGHIGFVVKLDATGEVLWARELTQDMGMNGLSDAAAFPDGSIVATGYFDRMLPIGPTVLAAVGSDFPGRTQFPDLLAVRFDADGELEWARREGGEVWDGGTQVEPLDDGGVLVTGSYTNTVTFAEDEPGATTLTTPTNESTAFVAVLNRNGSLRWVRKGVSGQAALLSDGSVAIAKAFMGTLTIFPDEPGETTLASAGAWDVYVVRLGWADGTP